MVNMQECQQEKPDVSESPHSRQNNPIARFKKAHCHHHRKKQTGARFSTKTHYGIGHNPSIMLAGFGIW